MRRRIPHRTISGIEQKYCKTCDQWHSLEKFNKKAASYDGLETKCKQCAQSKSAKFRKSHPNYDKQYQVQNNERLRAYKREYYQRNRKVDNDLDNS